MLDWSEFIEGEGQGDLLDDPCPDPDSGRFAITISPPRRTFPFRISMYMDLYPYRHYILNEQLKICPEFEKGRLHYHGTFKTTEDMYGHEYEFWYMHNGHQRHWFKLSKFIGLTKRFNKPRYKIISKGVKSSMNYVKFKNISDDWVEYCEKHGEETEKILGFSLISPQIWQELETDFLYMYKYECPETH